MHVATISRVLPWSRHLALVIQEGRVVIASIRQPYRVHLQGMSLATECTAIIPWRYNTSLDKDGSANSAGINWTVYWLTKTARGRLLHELAVP
jgi:hypothetical protein